MSHGSSLTTELLGDVGTFTTASAALKASAGREAPLCRTALLLGDGGWGDSVLWKEMRNEGLSERATMEKGVKSVWLSDKGKSQLFSSSALLRFYITTH